MQTGPVLGRHKERKCTGQAADPYKQLRRVKRLPKVPQNQSHALSQLLPDQIARLSRALAQAEPVWTGIPKNLICKPSPHALPRTCHCTPPFRTALSPKSAMVSGRGPMKMIPAASFRAWDLRGAGCRKNELMQIKIKYKYLKVISWQSRLWVWNWVDHALVLWAATTPKQFLTSPYILYPSRRVASQAAANSALSLRKP